jgi:hypothetical protein
MAEVKAAGRYRQEGKAYVVEDGDIIHFRELRLLVICVALCAIYASVDVVFKLYNAETIMCVAL